MNENRKKRRETIKIANSKRNDVGIAEETEIVDGCKVQKQLAWLANKKIGRKCHMRYEIQVNMISQILHLHHLLHEEA